MRFRHLAHSGAGAEQGAATAPMSSLEVVALHELAEIFGIGR
jgi:hypothetical protein